MSAPVAVLTAQHVVEQALEVIASVRIALDRIAASESARGERGRDVFLKETANVGDDLGAAWVVGFGRESRESEPQHVPAEVVAVRGAVVLECRALEPVEPQVDRLDDGDLAVSRSIGRGASRTRSRGRRSALRVGKPESIATGASMPATPSEAM